MASSFSSLRTGKGSAIPRCLCYIHLAKFRALIVMILWRCGTQPWRNVSFLYPLDSVRSLLLPATIPSDIQFTGTWLWLTVALTLHLFDWLHYWYDRDSTIVSFADTGTSILAGVTIFSILGNLAYETGQLGNIGAVVSGGPGLAFVSYPDAISKFDAVPQVAWHFSHLVRKLFNWSLSISFLRCYSFSCSSRWLSGVQRDCVAVSSRFCVMISLNVLAGSSRPECALQLVKTFHFEMV